MAEPRLRASFETRSSIDTARARSPILRRTSDAADRLSIPSISKRSFVGRVLGESRPWRRLVGLTLLLTTVFLWTASNFLASTIFADDSYSKPYFVTYVNSATFIIPLIPILLRKIHKNPEEARTWPREFIASFRRRPSEISRHGDARAGTPYHIETPDAVESQELLLDDSQQLSGPSKDHAASISSYKGQVTVPAIQWVI